jgi:hypothetical protein
MPNKSSEKSYVIVPVISGIRIRDLEQRSAGTGMKIIPDPSSETFTHTPFLLKYLPGIRIRDPELKVSQNRDESILDPHHCLLQCYRAGQASSFFCIQNFPFKILNTDFTTNIRSFFFHYRYRYINFSACC